MKNIISNLISAAATSIVVMIFGIPMLTALAVMVAFLLMKKIVEVIYEHVSEKKMPSISQWVEYSLLLVAFILIVCGINYSSIVCVIIGAISLIGSFSAEYFGHKKAKEVPEE